MMLWSAKLSIIILLAASASISVSASSLHDLRDSLPESELEVKLRHGIDEILDNIARRQDASSPTSTASAPKLSGRPASDNVSKSNYTAWDEQTSQACMNALMKFGGTATNPAGMAICYNVPFLDNSTGVFQADLRLYQIAEPTGDFVGIPPQNIHLGLSYVGATVSAANFSSLHKRNILFSRPPIIKGRNTQN